MISLDKARRPEISLGDVLRALARLKPKTDTQTSEILRCLGFQTSSVYQSPQPYRSNQGAWNRNHFRKKPQQKPSPNYAPQPTLPPTPEVPIALPKEVLHSTLEVLPDAGAINPSTTINPKVENATPLSLSAKGISPSRISLLPKNRARAITSATIAQYTAGVDLNIPRLVQTVIQRKPLYSIPRLPQKTIRNGCHLLLDFSDALLPWWQDMRDLKRQFHDILDESICKTFEFENDPMAAVRWSESMGDVVWRPEKKRPVVLATDLGITHHPTLGLRPDTTTWVRLAQFCHRAEAPLIAMVPIHPDRWPKGLDRWMRIIHWHPATSAATVNRLLAQNINGRRATL